MSQKMSQDRSWEAYYSLAHRWRSRANEEMKFVIWREKIFFNFRLNSQIKQGFGLLLARVHVRFYKILSLISSEESLFIRLGQFLKHFFGLWSKLFNLTIFYHLNVSDIYLFRLFAYVNEKILQNIDKIENCHTVWLIPQ